MTATDSLTGEHGPGTSGPMPRPAKDLELVGVKLRPDQAKALREAALRAKLEGLPEAGDGASRIVRALIDRWIAAGARWPGATATKAPRRPRKT